MAVIDGGLEDLDAAIIRADSPLPLDHQFAIRHQTKVVSADTIAGADPELRLLGIVNDTFEPGVEDASVEDGRMRIMVTHVATTEEMRIYYVDSFGSVAHWDGSGWWGGMGSFASSPLDIYHVVEMESDGVDWWIRVLEEDGTLITQTDPAPWSDVYGLTDDLWFYWGEVYTDQYWGLQRSDWLYLRDFVNPEPTTSLGTEQGQPAVDITVTVHHTAADGSDPQLIVSNSTSVNGLSADPLIVDLGTGAEQTFSPTDPRKLRVRITVDAVNGGGAFTLAYDSSTDQSRLEAPSLTVLDVALLLGLVAVFIPIVTALATERRRMATRIISVILALLLALAVLSSQVAPVTAAPDSFYLHDSDTSGITPAGESLAPAAPTVPAPPSEFAAGPNYR